jgi:hypothetical protein
MAEMLMDTMDWTFFLIDIISLGTSRVARKAATKLISLAVRRRGMMAVEELEHAGMAAAKVLRTAEKIETLTLRAPQIQRIERAGEAIQELTSSGKKTERMLAAGVSGKKKNIGELSREAGMTNMAVRDVRQKMQKHGVRVRFRPAGEARKLRKSGAIPKWEELKMKTISKDDVLLGAPKDGIGKPGYFKPDLPNSSLKTSDPATYERLMKRHAQREEEFRQLAGKVQKYVEDGDIIVKDKVVYDGPTGKDIAGDYDIYEILDKKGNHIGPSDPRYNRILDDLRGRRIGAQHGAHVDWNPTDPFEIKIKQEIVDRHRTTVPLYEFREDGSVWKVFAD